MTLREFLKTKVQSSELSIKEISINSKVSQTTIRSLLKFDGCKPLARTLIPVLHALNVTLDDLRTYKVEL